MLCCVFPINFPCSLPSSGAIHRVGCINKTVWPLITGRCLGKTLLLFSTQYPDCQHQDSFTPQKCNVKEQVALSANLVTGVKNVKSKEKPSLRKAYANCFLSANKQTDCPCVSMAGLWVNNCQETPPVDFNFSCLSHVHFPWRYTYTSVTSDWAYLIITQQDNWHDILSVHSNQMYKSNQIFINIS